jgi:uncharacterized protein with HEPN domain
MSRRSIRVLLEDMRDRCGRIERFLGGVSYEAFLADDKTCDSVVRNLEVIGEAASRLPKEFTSAHVGVPWRLIVGMRHRIVHDYFDVDLALVFDICRHEIPELEAKLAELLARLGEGA